VANAESVVTCDSGVDAKMNQVERGMEHLTIVSSALDAVGASVQNVGAAKKRIVKRVRWRTQ
jgi:hypothetical protein